MPFLILAMAVVGADPWPEEAQQELKLLLGNWMIKSSERDGKQLEYEQPNDYIFEIKDDKWMSDGKEHSRIIGIDPKANPKCYDLKALGNNEGGRVSRVIYKLEGNTLTTCYSFDNIRPEKFRSLDDRTVVAVWKRIKQ